MSSGARREEARPPSPGYEVSDARTRPLILFALLLALLLGASLAVSAWLSQDLTEDLRSGQEVSPLSALRVPAPGPELQAVPGVELERKRAWERDWLEGPGSTGWIDPVNKIVHIPIDLAIDKLLEEGLPTRPPLEDPGTVRGGEDPRKP